MEKSQQPPLPPPPQQSLKCPRCDSANTKFCYYNNYSLSQPRHFCKACKRYWTRGGTLRNVPVGGGCRKNKRVKRANSSSSGAGEGGCNPNSNPNPNYSSGSQIDISISGSSTPNHHQISPLFYGLGSSEMNLGFPGRFSSGGYDLNPQLNALALGFSSGKQIQDSSSMLSNYSIFGSCLMNQSKLISSPGGGGAAFEELHLNGNNSTNVKEVKVELQEQQQSRFDWNNNNNENLASSCQNQIEQIGFSSLDPSLYWNPNSTTSWHDPNNLSSSLTSLI